MFELVKGGVQRPLADLEDVGGSGAEALRDGEAMEGLERDETENQAVEGALDEIGWLAHVCFGNRDNATSAPTMQERRYLASVGFSMRAMTTTSTGPRPASSFSPSCSCTAVKMVGARGPVEVVVIDPLEKPTPD